MRLHKEDHGVQETKVQNPKIIIMLVEKKAEEIDVSSTPDMSTGDVETQGFDHVATKKLLRKLDWHIIPFMSLIYLLSVHQLVIISREATDAVKMLSRSNKYRQRPPRPSRAGSKAPRPAIQ